MIFNSEYTGTSEFDNMVVTESPYPLGLEGALMHVYENECNYNAMMKAVGISELRYYQETGEDLFVQEAGAFSGLVGKVKSFFKKVIEKIKQIFHKFAAVIAQYTMDDKKFVKKYEKELYRKDLKDFEFNGYEFTNLNTKAGEITSKCATLAQSLTGIASGTTPTHADGRDNRITGLGADTIKYTDTNIGTELTSADYADSDKVSDVKEKNRAVMIGDTGSYDESDLRDELKEKLYGDTDKSSFDVKNIREWLTYITETSKDVKDAEKSQKTLTKAIEGFIRDAERFQNTYAKISDAEKSGANADSVRTTKNNNIKKLNYHLDICRAASNDFTVIFGMITQAFKDRNRQAKAICVKALSYKHESVDMRYESSYDSDDIFAGVVIR